jgi:hypothetical protein
MQRASERIKTGPFALETLSQASVPNSTNTAINPVDGVHASLQRVKKKELAEALVPDLGGRNFVHAHSYPKVLLSSTGPLKFLLRLTGRIMPCDSQIARPK